MQKVYFCQEENTKPFDCNCATFYTKIFNLFFIWSKSHWSTSLKYRDINEMAERLSQKNLRVRPSSDEEKIVTNA